MSELRSHRTIYILSLIVLVLLVGALATTAALCWWGDWEKHDFGLKLTLRIIWGCWLLTGVATLLTRVTMFGWYFRRYYRWPEEGAAAKVLMPKRPTVAPWYKSGAESFSITVVLVSLTGVVLLAAAVMWIVSDLTGKWVFFLVLRILGASWWVLVIAVVVTRVSIFGARKKKTTSAAPTSPPSPVEVSGPGNTGPEEKPPTV
jgi:hypothetical protein